MKKLLLLALFLAGLTPAARAQADDPRIDRLISQMTPEEKVRMCFGGTIKGKVVFPGVARLGVPDMRASDGPRGVGGGGASTSFPSGLGMGATWDAPLHEEVGQVIGEEARAKGFSVIFGPAFNIERDPLGGRFFEYVTEDPLLNGKLAAAEVRGIQNRQVAATIKHFAANNREWNRNLYMSNVDERTLREIELRGFEIAVKEGHPWCAMTAANGLNGDLASDSKFLLRDVLKDQWGFDGFVCTDFCHSRTTAKAALAGLDVSMPWETWETGKFAKPLLDAVQAGLVPMSNLDDKVRRILRVEIRLGLLDGKKPTDGGVLNTPEHVALAKKAAEESLVLLKNQGGLLPLDAAKLKHVVVLGPNADRKFCIGGAGGSSGVGAPSEVTVLAGLQQRLGAAVEVEYLRISGDAVFSTIGPESFTALPGGVKGVTIHYTSSDPADQPFDATAGAVDFKWSSGSPDATKIKPGHVKVIAEGNITVTTTGLYTLRLISDSPANAWFQDMGAPTIQNHEQGVPQANTALIHVEAGKTYQIKVGYGQTPASLHNSTEMNYWAKDNPGLRLEWSPPSDAAAVAKTLEPVSAKIKAADAVIVVGGLDHNLDCEGRDRADMNFPPGQEALIRQVAALNSETVVVLIHGSPIQLGGWLDQVPAVLDAFYPGMEGGAAVAEALTGDIDPSGKLSFTWPKRLEDSPTYALGTQDHDNVNWKEGVFVGYRYFDSRHVEPQFPFGFGLSYTRFDYAHLTAQRAGDQVLVDLDVKNSGPVAGAEVVQFYVAPPKETVERPVHELKAFSRVDLQPGETKHVQVKLDPQAFSYWSIADKNWKLEPGAYGIEAAASSRDIRQKTSIER